MKQIGSWLCSMCVLVGVGACGGDDGGGGGGPDGGIPGLNNNIACTMDTGAGTFCIGIENITKGQYDSEHDSCMQQGGTVSAKCSSDMLAGCCETNNVVIQLECDYSDLPAVTIMHDMQACSSPATWVTTIP